MGPLVGRQDMVLYYATNRQHRDVTDPDKFFADSAASPASRVSYGRYPGSADRNGENFLPGNLRIIKTDAWFDEVRSLAVVNGKPEWRIAQPSLWDKSREPVLSAAALFAADVDKDTYAGSYSRTVNGGAKSVLIYASAKDRALAASRGFHGSEPRLGQTDPSPYRDDKAETIDASDAGSDFLGHGYFAGNRAVISDLAYAIGDGIPAWRRRGLKAEPSVLAPKYWWLLVN
jgi:hypothetical protein